MACRFVFSFEAWTNWKFPIALVTSPGGFSVASFTGLVADFPCSNQMGNLLLRLRFCCRLAISSWTSTVWSVTHLCMTKQLRYCSKYQWVIRDWLYSLGTVLYLEGRKRKRDLAVEEMAAAVEEMALHLREYFTRRCHSFNVMCQLLLSCSLKAGRLCFSRRANEVLVMTVRNINKVPIRPITPDDQATANWAQSKAATDFLMSKRSPSVTSDPGVRQPAQPVAAARGKRLR